MATKAKTAKVVKPRLENLPAIDDIRMYLQEAADAVTKAQDLAKVEAEHLAKATTLKAESSALIESAGELVSRLADVEDILDILGLTPLVTLAKDNFQSQLNEEVLKLGKGIDEANETAQAVWAENAAAKAIRDAAVAKEQAKQVKLQQQLADAKATIHARLSILTQADLETLQERYRARYQKLSDAEKANKVGLRLDCLRSWLRGLNVRPELVDQLSDDDLRQAERTLAAAQSAAYEARNKGKTKVQQQSGSSDDDADDEADQTAPRGVASAAADIKFVGGMSARDRFAAHRILSPVAEKAAELGKFIDGTVKVTKNGVMVFKGRNADSTGVEFPLRGDLFRAFGLNQ